MPEHKIGAIEWVDLTVPDAETLRDFYREVVGWEAVDHDMGGYQDFSMKRPGSDEVVAGICHARGPNAEIPPRWLVYIRVGDLDASLAACREKGGKVLLQPRDLGSYGRMAVIQDPAGAVAALMG